MNKLQLQQETLSKWLDNNKLVKTHAEWADSGNGILYSAILILFLGSRIASDCAPWFNAQTAKCFYKRGCLMRNPSNTFGQEQWDDYLGLIAACIVLRNTRVPRQMLWYGITHLGFYRNVPKFTWSAFLWRFPQVWILCFAAAFPLLKWAMWPALGLAARLQNFGSGPGEIITSWVYLASCKELGFTFSKYQTAVQLLHGAIVNQFDINHPYNLFTQSEPQS